MPLYMSGEGFKSIDDDVEAIEHYKSYTGFSLMIEKKVNSASSDSMCVGFTKIILTMCHFSMNEEPL